MARGGAAFLRGVVVNDCLNNGIRELPVLGNHAPEFAVMDVQDLPFRFQRAGISLGACPVKPRERFRIQEPGQVQFANVVEEGGGEGFGGDRGGAIVWQKLGYQGGGDAVLLKFPSGKSELRELGFHDTPGVGGCGKRKQLGRANPHGCLFDGSGRSGTAGGG